MSNIKRALRLAAGTAIAASMGVTGAYAQSIPDLNPNADPWDNFDLTEWAIDTPAEDDGGASRTNEFDLVNGNLNVSDDEDYFYTAPDGGMRFENRLGGYTTGDQIGNTDNGSFVRSELREMLRDCPSGNGCASTRSERNNWALEGQPTGGDHAARGGRLLASLRVNQVATTGDRSQNLGAVIIGQIHAEEDEPLRIYYRKLPEWDRGCMYLAHEIREGDDEEIAVLGGSDCFSDNPREPGNGIELNELFSYRVIQQGNRIIFELYRGDLDEDRDRKRTINMRTRDSGYLDEADEWMYFKAGAYTGNDTGNSNDGDIVTFYFLNNPHPGR